MLATLRGTFVALGLVVEVSSIGTGIFIAALVAKITGSTACLRVAQWLERLCATTTYHWLRLCLPTIWEIEHQTPPPKDQWLLATANHCSWLDVVIAGTALRQLPPLRFFLKKVLIWIPVVGQACWALGYIFLNRHTASQIRKKPKLKGSDMVLLKKGCQRFIQLPVTIFAFPEGTRFTRAKHQRRNSPYQYLLVPQAAGVAATIAAMPTDKLTQWLDLTFYYQAPNVSLWQFLCGRIPKLIVTSQLHLITDDLRGDFQNNRDFRRHFQNFLNQLWQTKDQRIEHLHDQSE